MTTKVPAGRAAGVTLATAAVATVPATATPAASVATPAPPAAVRPATPSSEQPVPIAAIAPSLAQECSTALAYLAVHAKPGFAHYCRPGPLGTGNSVAFTCVPSRRFTCPDGRPEIVIADPACAITYENEASNSYWNFNDGTVAAGTVQQGRTWDPYGECP